MWVVVASALAARRGQAIVVALVALVASAAAAMAPWYAVAAAEQVAVAAVAGTPIDRRILSVSYRPDVDEPHPVDPGGEFRQAYAPAGFDAVAGGLASAELAHGDQTGWANLAYREQVCDHLQITGVCPTSAGEVVISAALAEALGAASGDELAVERAGDLAAVRVVGVYEVTDPTDPYWANGELVGLGASAVASQETAFTAAVALAGQRVTYTYELIAIPEAFATTSLDAFEAELTVGVAELRRRDYAVNGTGLDAMIDRIAQDQERLTTRIAVGMAALLLLTWFTLVVVLRDAVTQLREDVGWWRLHGVPAGRGWVAALGQSVVPLLAGAALGTAAGLGLGRTWHEAASSGAPRTALLLALALVGLAVAGGLVAVVATQLGSLRTPVRDLLRRVPARRRRWRRSVVDLMLVVLAAAAVGQVLLVGPDAGGVAQLAPGLAVLAIALVAAWALPPLAAAGAARGLRAGRLGVALVAGSVARRTGSQRLVAMVAVAVGLVTTALIGWDTDTRTQQQRAALETGADRVVTVAPVDAGRLLAAVRAADPRGTQAMAAIHRRATGGGHPQTLAVDSTRLGVVTPWLTGYGGDPDEVAAALRPAAPEPVTVTGDRLEVEATGGDPAGRALLLRVLLRTLATGEPVEAVLGPLTAEPARYRAAVPACAGASGRGEVGGKDTGAPGRGEVGGKDTGGCRLVGFELLGPERPGSGGHAVPGGESEAELRLAGASEAADPARWRPTLDPEGLGPAITTGERGLHLRARALPDDPELTRDGWALVVDAPAPLPALAAGWSADPTAELRLTPLSGEPVPVKLVGTAPILPYLGRAGVLVDLEYAQRLVPFARTGGTAQVWLSPTAPASIVDDLRTAGLTPLRVDSRADLLTQLRAEGSAVGVRFQAAVAAVGLLLAAGAVLVLAAQQRAGRAAELAALRAQGLGAGVVRLVGYGGQAVVIGAATAVGLAAGTAAALVTRRLHPGFLDGWSVLPAAPLHPYPVLAAAATAVVLLGAAVLATGVALVRRTRAAS